MQRLIAVALPFAACLLTSASASDCPAQFGCPRCQSCDKTCVVRVEQVDGEEDCHEVECKEVCIPAVRFPWESCRTPKCGRVRLVSRLKKESRETKSCEYEWQVVCTRCGRCVAPAKGDGGKDEEGASTVPPAPEGPPMPPPVPGAEQARRPSPTSTARIGLARPHVRPIGYNARSSTR